MSPRWPRTLRYITLVLLIVALGLSVYYLRDLLRPLAAAAFLAYLLTPVVNTVSRRTGWGHRRAGNVVYFLSLALVIGLIAWLVPALLGQMEEIAHAFTLVSENVERLLSTPIRLGQFVFYPNLSLPELSTIVEQMTSTFVADAFALVESTSRSLAWFLVFLVSWYYFLTHWGHIRDWMLGLAPPAYESDARQLYEQIRTVWIGYLWGQMALVFIVGVVFTLIWVLIGLPGALVIGPLTGLLTLIPDLGPLIGTIIAALVALLEGSYYLQMSNFWFMVLVLAIYGVLMVIKNIWVRPRVMGRSVQMNEGIVFVAIVAGVIYGGILGALVIVPVLASLGVIGRYLRQRILGLEPFPPPKLPDQPEVQVQSPEVRKEEELEKVEP
jgi:predicted PurR-regulated permease PerM